MIKMNLSLLASNNYRIYNYEIAKKIGVKEAILLADLISKHIYFQERDLLDKQDYFFSTAEGIEETTALSRREQERCIKKLVGLSLIETGLKGVPAKKHFRITENIENLFFASKQKGKPSFDKKVKLGLTKSENKVLQKGERINNIKNNIKNNINISFENFWNLYDFKKSKGKVEKKWNSLSDKERKEVMKVLPNYVETTFKNGRYPSRKHPATYLNQECWEDEIAETGNNCVDYDKMFNN